MLILGLLLVGRQFVLNKVYTIKWIGSARKARLHRRFVLIAHTFGLVVVRIEVALAQAEGEASASYLARDVEVEAVLIAPEFVVHVVTLERHAVVLVARLYFLEVAATDIGITSAQFQEFPHLVGSPEAEVPAQGFRGVFLEAVLHPSVNGEILTKRLLGRHAGPHAEIVLRHQASRTEQAERSKEKAFSRKHCR